MRVSGKSECRHSGRHDSWVDAADLAYCAQVCFCAPENRVPLELTFSLPSRSRLAPPPIPLPHPRYGEHLHKLRPQICCAVSFQTYGSTTRRPSSPRNAETLIFACSFPEMCLSLTLCNIPPPTEYVIFY
jgi:hypothetical protein